MSETNKGTRSNSQEQTMNVIEQKIRDYAHAENQQGLVELVTEAMAHPESAVATHLEVEGLRIAGHAFFGRAKGIIGHLQGSRPDVHQPEAVEALGKYEEVVSSYLAAQGKTLEAIVGSPEDKPEDATLVALGALRSTIAGWDDVTVSKPFLTLALSNVGTRNHGALDLRKSLTSTTDGIKESMWEVVQLGREVRVELSKPDANVADIAKAYTADSDEEFLLANRTVTDGLTKLTKMDAS